MNVNPPPLLPNAPPFRHLPDRVATPLARAERKICKRSREELYDFDIRGNEVLYVSGQHPREIELGDEAAALCRDRIVTHNHPNQGGSFSIVDLEFAIKNDVREFRVVDGVRWQFVYSLYRPDGGWPEGFFEEVYDDSNLHDALELAVRAIHEAARSLQGMARLRSVASAHDRDSGSR